MSTKTPTTTPITTAEKVAAIEARIDVGDALAAEGTTYEAAVEATRKAMGCKSKSDAAAALSRYVDHRKAQREHR